MDKIDQLIQNAKRLGGLTWVVDLVNKRGWLSTINQEEKYQLYWELYERQQRLLKEIQNEVR